MLELLQDGGIWLVTGCLMLVGLAGCVLPVLPGHLIILTGAVGYRLMKGAEAGIGWWGFGVLIGLMVFSQAFEILSGSLGSRWFGGSRWGAVGALVGSLVGLFFLPFGLLVGPLAGAFGFEMLFAKKKTGASAASGVGSVVGTLVGMGSKVVVGLLMVAWFLADVFWIGN
jgi:uncharacterized protein